MSADTLLLLCLGRALRSVYLINVICTVTTLIHFHSAAQWTPRPYLALGPAAAISSQGWLCDPSEQISALRRPDPSAHCSQSNDLLSRKRLHAATGPLEEFRNINGENRLHLEENQCWQCLRYRAEND